MKHLEKNDLFQASQLTILLSYTVFSIILIAEAFLMHWEIWPLIPITIGVAASWILHLNQRFTERSRIWVYSAFIMFTFFFYGSHRTWNHRPRDRHQEAHHLFAVSVLHHIRLRAAGAAA